jgi:nicotinamide riboside kinase
LCDYKIPWEADPLRENPDNRDELFELYVKKIEEYELRYSLVEGEPQERLQQALHSSNS